MLNKDEMIVNAKYIQYVFLLSQMFRVNLVLKSEISFLKIEN